MKTLHIIAAFAAALSATISVSPAAAQAPAPGGRVVVS